jgi:hypothetical protein
MRHASRNLQPVRGGADVVNTMPAGSKGDPIVASLTKGVTDVARGAAAVSASVARHAAWYVRYRVDGNKRAQYKRDRPGRARR